MRRGERQRRCPARGYTGNTTIERADSFGELFHQVTVEKSEEKRREKTILKIKDTDKLAEYLDDNNINYEKTGKEEITIYNKINIPKFITELNNNKIEIIDIKFEAENKMYYAMVIYRERQING